VPALSPDPERNWHNVEVSAHASGCVLRRVEKGQAGGWQVMADTKTVYRSSFPWALIFIVAKLAGIPGIVAWSWWWILFAVVPIAVEVLKALLAR
jgi:hypothetical protein